LAVASAELFTIAAGFPADKVVPFAMTPLDPEGTALAAIAATDSSTIRALISDTNPDCQG
jgi:hypothetical protein